jgi:hypothetical protein
VANASPKRLTTALLEGEVLIRQRADCRYGALRLLRIEAAGLLISISPFLGRLRP